MRKRATDLAARAANPAADPRHASQQVVLARQLNVEADDLAARAHGNEEAIADIEKLIIKLQTGKCSGSRHRSLALAELENASMRLRRENGDAPDLNK